MRREPGRIGSSARLSAVEQNVAAADVVLDDNGLGRIASLPSHGTRVRDHDADIRMVTGLSAAAHD